MNKKTAILIGVIILVLTSIITPFFIRKLNKKVEETQKVQEEQEVQEPVETTNTEEVLKESEEQASGEQLTEENQTESEVEEDEKIEEQPKTNESKVQSTKLKSSLQSTTTNATSNEKQPAKKEENTVSEVQDIEEVIVENAVVIDVASVNQEQTQVVEQIQEQIAEVPVVPEALQPQNVVLPDGAVGILKIDKLGINQKVADGHSLEVLKTDLGHVDSTAYSTGNVGILGHNSGNAGYFKNLWDLKQDDIIEYTTSDGVRTYKVSEVVQIADDDWSKLANTTDNRITLITCVKNVPEKRWCIQGIEI